MIFAEATSWPDVAMGASILLFLIAMFALVIWETR